MLMGKLEHMKQAGNIDIRIECALWCFTARIVSDLWEEALSITNKWLVASNK